MYNVHIYQQTSRVYHYTYTYLPQASSMYYGGLWMTTMAMITHHCTWTTAHWRGVRYNSTVDIVITSSPSHDPSGMCICYSWDNSHRERCVLHGQEKTSIILAH